MQLFRLMDLKYGELINLRAFFYIFINSDLKS